MPYSARKKSILTQSNLPKHIAIIMDGNGRWAKGKNLPRLAGHKEGINSVREITRVCGEIGIQHLTLYTFSSENWSRPETEVSAIMRLLLFTIEKEINNLHKNNVRLTTIGNLMDLPREARKGIEEGMALTQENTGLNLILALSYGSRQEIVSAVREISKRVRAGEMTSDAIDEATISKALNTAETPDPDLLIRTGGEMRISNFLLWQSAYTELYMTETYWPEFREQQLLEAVETFQCRERRYGKISEQLVS